MAEIIKLGSNGNWGVKPNGVLAYNDENNIFKAIELQSSRASGATYVGEDGLIKDAEVGVPRIDWTNGVGGLLLEPQSTNLIPYSEDFTDASWTKRGVPIVSGSVLSPKGDLSATRLNLGAAAVLDIFTSVSGLTPSQKYSASFFIKKVSSAGIIRVAAAVTTGAWNVDLSLLSDEWTLIDESHEAVTVIDEFESTAGGGGGLQFSSQLGEITIDVWGCQIEDLSYSTSYIPTSGSAATRVGEVSEKVIPSELSLSTRGTVFLDYTLNINLISGHFPFSIIDYNNGSPNEWVSRGSFRFIINTNGSVSYDFVLSGLVTSPTIVSNIFPNIGSRGKMAVSWNGTNVTFSVNGVNYQDTLSANFTGSLDGVYLGQLGTFNNTHIGGKFNEVKLYNTALTDQELKALTS